MLILLTNLMTKTLLQVLAKVLDAQEWHVLAFSYRFSNQYGSQVIPVSAFDVRLTVDTHSDLKRLQILADDAKHRTVLRSQSLTQCNGNLNQ